MTRLSKNNAQHTMNLRYCYAPKLLLHSRILALILTLSSNACFFFLARLLLTLFFFSCSHSRSCSCSYSLKRLIPKIRIHIRLLMASSVIMLLLSDHATYCCKLRYDSGDRSHIPTRVMSSCFVLAT